ncbi:MAG TPA: type II toxin-antitoxin system prevent-host-death family antitoxin [Propionicimonas sp.]|nr:type II toxin-antitoxin system prevent-host-death family antitoxin [Propionicimonas sp.]HQA78605.1 type II toxin-antitoxin system prevent-host-death family antitoxin [Propionicimonas sp.]HQD96976.1 type II toxin-antitoxin system prevent-host-death family antitoxin [Propionicimonas sp.]
MTTVNVQEAKTRLSELLARVERGEEIVVARAGTPVARLVPVDLAWTRPFGRLAFEVPEDFDAPLDEDELVAWE